MSVDPDPNPTGVQDIAIKEWPGLTVKLHPLLFAFLEGRVRKSGRSLEAEAGTVIGEAMERAELPPVPTTTPFQCSAELMAEKAICKDCGQTARHHAKVWAERHVQATGHRVEVSLYLDMRDDAWVDKLTPERRAKLDEVRDGDVSRALAQQLLGGTRH